MAEDEVYQLLERDKGVEPVSRSKPICPHCARAKKPSPRCPSARDGTPFSLGGQERLGRGGMPKQDGTPFRLGGQKRLGVWGEGCGVS